MSQFKFPILKPKVELMSKILHNAESIPKDKSSLSSCKSLKLMLSKGFIKHSSPGMFVLKPLIIRSFEKLNNIVDSMMKSADCQKILFPSLLPKTYLRTSGRWETIDNLFKLKDRSGQEYCLAPTHEEMAHALLSEGNLSYHSLPIRVYQISSKFRDEMNPKLGLLRAREFIMKDMYAFDTSEETALITYNRVCELYRELFTKYLGIEPVVVQASSGEIGGNKSHEFHLLSDVGEDEVLICPSCKTGMNVEVVADILNAKCYTCNAPLQKNSALEIGHAFMLGYTYSKPFKVKYNSSENKLRDCFSSCYGLGMSRILAACIENLSTSTQLRWPFSIVPFYVSVVPPKKNSKEEAARPISGNLVESLNNLQNLSGNIVIDDRTSLTIGKRVQDCSELGIPYLIIIGKHTLENIPKFEIIDVYNNKTIFLSHRETMEMFKYNVLL